MYNKLRVKSTYPTNICQCFSELSSCFVSVESPLDRFMRGLKDTKWTGIGVCVCVHMCVCVCVCVHVRVCRGEGRNKERVYDKCALVLSDN